MRMLSRAFGIAFMSCVMLAPPLVHPLAAETIEELDAIAEIAVDEEQGILFAQEQASRGEILDAIATLERVLVLHPKSQSARLLHAVYLCRIDDKVGGAVELGKLKSKNFPDEMWARALQICSVAAED